MLITGIASISGLVTLGALLLGPVTAPLILILTYTVNFFSVLLLWALACLVCTMFVKKDTPCEKHSNLFRFFTNCILDTIMQIFRVKIHVTGMDRLPKEKFLLVCNHRSAMDPLVCMTVLRDYHIGFVAKQELFRMPVVGKLMHKSFCLPLNRDSLRGGIQMIQQAAGIIKSQEASIGIFPEGTRSQDGRLLPFKNGAFKIAQKGECPIVVAVIRGTERIMKNAPFHKTHVYLDIIEIISAGELMSCKTAEIGTRVYDAMNQALTGQERI